MARKKGRASRAARDHGHSDEDAGSSSFVLDTNSAEIPAQTAPAPPAQDEVAPTPARTTPRSTADPTGGLDLPGHVAIVTGPSERSREPSPPTTAADGDYDQLDAAPASRYYEAEAQDERRQKGVCPVCGEAGHDKKRCPYQQCLACGAVDEHATRDCPLGTSCFRCGGVGHRSRDCPQPHTGGRRGICERCGSTAHPETSCPTLWRIYTYNTPQEYAARRAKRARHLERRAERKSERMQRHEKQRTGWAAALVQPSDESGPSESSDSDVPADAPPKDWDPAFPWCYNCAASGHHWGDDCFLRRTNPTRPTGEASPFSEAMCATGPYAKPRSGLRLRGATQAPPQPTRRRRSDGFLARPSLLDMERDDDSDWFSRRQTLRQPIDYDVPAEDRRWLDGNRRYDSTRREERGMRPGTPRGGRPFASRPPRSSSPSGRRVRRSKGTRHFADTPSPFRPHYRGGYT